MFDPGTVTSTRGRVGARFSWAGQFAPFADAKLYHEFDGDSDVQVMSGTQSTSFERLGRGTWVRLEGGIGAGKGAGALLSGWVDLGDVRGLGLRRRRPLLKRAQAEKSGGGFERARRPFFMPDARRRTGTIRPGEVRR